MSANENEVPPVINPQVETSARKEFDKSIEGLGGWLILVMLGIIFGLLRSLSELKYFANIFIPNVWRSLITTDQIIIAIEILFSVISIFLIIVLGHKFFSKNKTFPKWFIGFQLFSFGFFAIYTVVLHFAFPDLTRNQPDSFCSAFFTFCIWVPYMLKSKRVKATFINRNPTPNLFYLIMIPSVIFLSIGIIFSFSRITMHQSGCVTVHTSIESSDLLSSVIMPPGWKWLEEEKSADDAILIGNEFSGEYLRVITDSKNQMPIEFNTIEKYLEFVKSNIVSDFSDSTLSDTKKTSLNGMNAFKIECTGNLDGLNLFYLVICVESEEYFHQIHAWTPLENQSRNVLDQVINTFEER